MWIDSHCHLNHDKIKEAGTASEIITRAKDAGICGMLSICCRIQSEYNEVFEITQNNDNVWMSIGTHPHDAGDEAEQAINEDEIIKLANNYDKIIGVGEAGLDYHYDFAPRGEQEDMFRKQIHVAKKTDLPLIIHTRDAEEDTMRILRDERACDGKTKVVMHCFSSNRWLAEQSIAEGFYMSFSGMITFKKNDELREIAKLVPLDKLLVETDAPYLAPEPHRGKINEPAFVSHTGQYIADLFNLTEQEMAAQTSENFFKLFDKALKTYK